MRYLSEIQHRILLPDGAGDAAGMPLRDLLFDGPGHCHILIDAARHSQLADMIATSARTASCLYRGEAKEKWGHVAPWLLTVTPDEQILRRLLRRGKAEWMLWDRAPAVFLRSDTPHAALVDHFRRFVKRRNEAGDWLFFRFHDPAVMTVYLHEVADWPERLNDFLLPRNGQPITRVIAPEPETDSATVFELDADFPPRRDASIATAPAYLTAREQAIFARTARDKVRQQMSEWLLRLDPQRFGLLNDASRLAITDHALSEAARFDMTFAEEACWLLYAMTYFGGWCFRSARYDQLTAAAAADTRKAARMSKALQQQAAAQFGTSSDWGQGAARIRDRIARHYHARGWHRLNRADLLPMIFSEVSAMAPEGRAIERLIRQQDLELVSLGLQDEPLRAAGMVLAFAVGLNFFTDPLMRLTYGGAGSDRQVQMTIRQAFDNYILTASQRAEAAGADYWLQVDKTRSQEMTPPHE